MPPTRFDIERALEQSTLPATARHIVLVLCTRIRYNTGAIPSAEQPSLNVLARAVNRNRRTIMRHLNVLERTRWIIRIRPTKHQARTEHAVTNYIVQIPDDFFYPQARGNSRPPLETGNRLPRGNDPHDLGAEDPRARGAASHKTSSSSSASSTRDEEEIETVIKAIFERTGKTISEELARKDIALIIGDKRIRNRSGYLRAAIANDPSPERFLPTPGPPKFDRTKGY